MPKNWLHHFVADKCVICGADESDASQGAIGCEAGADGNAPAYLGLAMTPYDYGLGYRSEDKAAFIFGDGQLAPEQLMTKHQEWRAKIRSELAKRGV